MSEERGFLKAILERPDDDTRKLVYADWLEEHGDPRGEYLRLMVKIRQERCVTEEQRRRHDELCAELADLLNQHAQAWRAGRGPSPESLGRRRHLLELECQLADLSRHMRESVPARLQELAATFDPNWLALVSDPQIEGCGKSAGDTWGFRFDLVCDQSWADMEPTDRPGVRHCETCSRNVHFCDNLADAREHAAEGHCIALDLGVIRRDGDLAPRSDIAGQPSRADLWRTYEEDLDPVSRARLKARKQARKKGTRKE